MDASNLLKPMLARGELHCIGATTLDEYHNTSRRTPRWNAASSRCWWTSRRWRTPSRFCAACGSATRCITACASKDAALVAAAVLSNRYISDRFLPDKAIDLMDEAAARLRTEIDSRPAELDERLRRIMQLEIEREALKKETDPASQERLAKIEKELAELHTEADALQRAGRTRSRPWRGWAR